MLASFFQACHPISSLDDLEVVLSSPPAWTERIEKRKVRSPTVTQNVLNDCHSDLTHHKPKIRYDQRFVPKTLICHDYKGGYKDDRYVHFPKENILGNGYTFYNWSQIDIFVYFSHHFITVPPLSWINAAHSNGVKIFGTLITEFDDGAKLCETVFKTRDSTEEFAKKLVHVTRMFKLDGWLLNIENRIEDKNILNNLQSFVKFFTQSVHELDEESMVIWYDSVTESGQLAWQNELNVQNKIYFESCDGIFLNYVWTENRLINTLEMAKYRNFDVYVGIDVFGRNTFGGGMFNCFKAAEMIRRYNLSIAIFAPGWTYETLPNNEHLFGDFLDRNSTLWSSLWPYFYTHPINDFFETSFYIGLDKKHYNLFSQEQQLSTFTHPRNISKFLPNLQNHPTLNHKCNCIQTNVIMERNSIFLTNHNLRKTGKFLHHLFTCDITLAGDAIVYYVIEAEQSTRLDFNLIICRESGCFFTVKLQEDGTTSTNNGVLVVTPLNEPAFIENVKEKYGFTGKNFHLCAYKFYMEKSKLLEIGATIVNGSSVNLCAFGIQKHRGSIFFEH